MKPEKIISHYMAIIGRKGDQKSRRKLDSRVTQTVIKLREAKRLYRKHHTQCFWSFDPNLEITKDDIEWVGEQLQKHGNRELWLKGKKLCR